MQKREAPIVIVGGGIAGCAIAYFLAKRGVHALVLEKASVGFEASGRNAGGVRAQCRDISAERILAMQSIKIWETFRDELGTDVEYVQGGTIRLADNEDRLNELTTQAAEELADGLGVEVWDRAQLYRRSPFLGDGFIGAKYCATDGVANPQLVTPALAAKAESMGAEIWTETEVDEILVQNGQIVGVHAHNAEGEWQIETPLVIHAAGPWTPQLGADLGLQIPVVPSRTVIARTEPMPFMFSEFISGHDVGVYARPDKRGAIHMGVVGQPIHTFEDCTKADIHAYMERRVNLIPALGEATIDEVWWGTLAMTPDRQPIIGRVDQLEGYILATGFSGHGFCLGPVVGKLVSELLLDGETSLPIDQFALERFADNAEFTRGKIQGTG